MCKLAARQGGKLSRLLELSEDAIRDAAWIVLDLELAFACRIEHYEDEKAIQFQDRWLSAFTDPNAK